jgi:hypothetical protein
MQEFYERADQGLGHYITREDIERRKPGRITHMIADSRDLPTARPGE